MLPLEYEKNISKQKFNVYVINFILLFSSTVSSLQVSTASQATTRWAAEEEEGEGAAKGLEAATLSTTTQWATAGEMAT